VHLVTIETKIQGVSETSKTRSVSTKVWQIKSVDKQGNITLVHSVAAVDMWQKTTGRQEVSYNSETDEKPPAEYAAVKESIGKPLATITIDPFGKITERASDRPQLSAVGDLTVPLPGQAIKVGQKWHMPETINVRLADGTVKPIKARQLYTLKSVQTGIATIDVRTEILTPINDPKIKFHLVQKMQHGEIEFDIDAGRIRRKQLDLDETVLGFAGNESLMQYLARLTEETLDEEPETTSSSRRTQRK
jgi:hypothetical protein